MPEDIDTENAWAEIYRLIGSVEAPRNWASSSGMQPYESYTDPSLRRAVMWHTEFRDLLMQRTEWASLIPPLDVDTLDLALREAIYQIERFIKFRNTNSYRCGSCHGLAISVSRHHYQACPCGKIAVDGGAIYGRRIGEQHLFEELGTSIKINSSEEANNDRQ